MKCNVNSLIDNVEQVFNVVVMVLLATLILYFAGFSVY
ncbi:hypothetical protein Aci011_001 [Acinetobacter phage vB_AbaM_B09_Aci01-1]|uniref:Uncharacterized protein n=1 Tax=Acinetobacter phage vB_AbaM_B09_Aci01-1 TaxID=2315466 RepID=A0A386KKS2_9CAUD|nr:hypothetical protein HOU29_gp001 [Acinetobacter phage vB_AbaM_B09_Aci01-1]AYD85684.1 hypothetical protein Aci011_001 [Acinetobacter phage vB_AbaM_B09_Aci01-1]